MNNDTFAHLGFKEGTFSLYLQKEDQEPREIFRDTTTERELARVSEALNFVDLEHMLTQIGLGDEYFIDVERAFEEELKLNIDELKSNQEQFEQSLAPAINNEVKEELIKNHINDLAASYSESVYESIAFKILAKVTELIIDELKIPAKELKTHERLITVISKNAPELDIKVTLI